MNFALTAENYRRLAMGALTRRVPVYAHFGITHRCNLTCKMCGIWRYGNEKEELSLDQIKDMAAKMRRLGVVQVAIGGGEPFATSHVEEAANMPPTPNAGVTDRWRCRASIGAPCCRRSGQCRSGSGRSAGSWSLRSPQRICPR